MSHTGPGVLPECTPSPSYTSTVTSFPSLDSSPSSGDPPPSDEEGLTQHLPPINAWSSIQPGTWDIHGIDSEFKYRVWFTWRLIKFSSWNIAGHGDVGNVAWIGREAEFWRSVCRADPAEDIWLWEDEDEEYIKTLIEDHLSDELEVSAVERSTACLALKARDRQRPHRRISSPVSPLTPEVRLRFMAWLVIVAVYPKEVRFQRASLHTLLQSWGYIIAGSQLMNGCGICRVSVHLNLWVDTMLHVYSVNHLQWISWDYPCSCFHDRLAAHSREIRAREMRLERILPRDSAPLRVLMELVVPPWPLILWVVFRTVATDRTQSVEAFLGILHGPNRDLFAWDYANQSDHLFLVLLNPSQIGLYPTHWMCYMAEIDLKTWMEIRNTIWTNRQLCFNPGDLPIRLAAASLLFSNTMSPPQNIPAALHVALDQFPFTVMADIVHGKRPEFPSSRDVDSKEFWTAWNLEGWLRWKGQFLCESVWKSTSHMTTLERIQFMHLLLSDVRGNYLPMQTYWCSLKQSGHQDGNFHDVQASLKNRGFLKSLIDYRSEFASLFTVLKDGKHSTKSNFFEPELISAAEVHGSMKDCLEVTIAGLVLFLQDRGLYKELLVYRGMNAQALLDLLQDFLDLDSFSLAKPVIYKALWRLSRDSGLHPRCFALTGLQKIGQQVAGGGFGDIWKGFVRGQTVCVKIMRIFQTDHIQTLLKEFSREALIWRQLCHPNLLPFFGLYYLEKRLCLVSPWMENGNVMEFLRSEPSHPIRLSLILDVALGLEYLHENKMVHGDLKGINILVTPSRRACIADFGLSSIINAVTLRLTTASAPARGGTARYQAPELFQGESTKTFETDIYAFGCVCYEILTGKIPFHELSNDMKVMWEVAAGKRPAQPPSYSGTIALDSLWELLQSCWNGQAQMRPNASQIVHRLMGSPISATTTSSTTDWDDEMTSRFRRSFQSKALLPSVAEIQSMIFGNG
ncbi:Protein kinase domain-containing protein [Mycena venus]|uniref:Protein kinase domain-containing protein n=1 Tax=Mycena venus TaxID=2733690 RepID=A0A8H6X3B5_9AGAR|nr:Protein kinase domain-containing protein [Mycena venus]